MGFSTVLWQLGNKLDAALVVAEAERTARGIVDPEKRALRFKNLEVFKSAIAEDPPLPLSVVPKPRLKPPPPVSGGLPPFPITVEGFRSSASAIASKAAESDQVFLTTLYALAGAQDRIGLAKQAATAVSARQRVLGVASLEHLLIQAGGLDGAEEAARAIPGDGLDLTLAKAEALAAAGRAWAVSRNLDNSVRCFNLTTPSSADESPCTRTRPGQSESRGGDCGIGSGLTFGGGQRWDVRCGYGLGAAGSVSHR